MVSRKRARPTTSDSIVIRITRVNYNFERESLQKPFGFKGGYLTELWQAITFLEGDGGERAVGLGTHSVLWSDSAVFAAHSEAGGNLLMSAVSEFAVQAARGRSFEDPLELQEALLPEAAAYARRITGREGLRLTFVLNALMALNFAAWVLYAAEKGVSSFDEMIPEAFLPALSHRHRRVAGSVLRVRTSTITWI